MSSKSECKLGFALPGTLEMRLGGGCELRHQESIARCAPPTRGGMARTPHTTELLRDGASSTPESPRAVRHARNRLPCRVSVSISDIFSTMPRSFCCKDTMQLAARDASSPSKGSPDASSRNWMPPRRWTSQGHHRKVDSRRSGNFSMDWNPDTGLATPMSEAGPDTPRIHRTARPKHDPALPPAGVRFAAVGPPHAALVRPDPWGIPRRWNDAMTGQLTR